MEHMIKVKPGSAFSGIMRLSGASLEDLNMLRLLSHQKPWVLSGRTGEEQFMAREKRKAQMRRVKWDTGAAKTYEEDNLWQSCKLWEAPLVLVCCGEPQDRTAYPEGRWGDLVMATASRIRGFSALHIIVQTEESSYLNPDLYTTYKDVVTRTRAGSIGTKRT